MKPKSYINMMLGAANVPDHKGNVKVRSASIDCEAPGLFRVDIVYADGGIGMAWEGTLEEARLLAARLLELGSSGLYSDEFLARTAGGKS